MSRRILFSLFLDQKRWRKIVSKHLCWERVDLQHFCNCEDEIWFVYHSYDDYQQDISWFEFLTKKMFSAMKYVGRIPLEISSCTFSCRLMRATPEVSRSYVTDKRQELFESWKTYLKILTMIALWSLRAIMRDMRNIPCCWEIWTWGTMTYQFLETHSSTEVLDTKSCVNVENDRSTTAWNGVSVRESTNEKIVALIPGLQNIRRMTLPQMYFESCSIFCGTYGRVNPLFSLPEDSVILLWNPGSHHRIFFMFMSQLYPHYKELQVNKWNIIAFSTETSGAIRRTTVGPPVNNECGTTASTSWSGRKRSNSSGRSWSSTGRRC